MLTTGYDETGMSLETDANNTPLATYLRDQKGTLLSLNTGGANIAMPATVWAASRAW